jgi:hypothetical protein
VAYPTITEAAGAESFTGVAKEATFGTPLAATSYFPDSGNTLNTDPGWFSPHLMMGLRDKQVYNLQGEEHNVGALDGPIFPSNAMALLVASIGADNLAGAGVTGTTGTGSTTLSAGTSIGAASISVASSTGFSTNQIIQIDVNGTGPVTTSEVRKITAIAGSGPYTLTLDPSGPTLAFAHASGAAVKGVVAPYVHTIQTQNTLESLTIEKNVGGTNRQSLQYAGCRVNKLDLKAPVSNEAASLTADIMAQSVLVLDSPSTPSVANENPFVFAEASLSFFSTTRYEAANLVVSVDNMLKESYTYSQNHGPSFITSTGLHVSGTLDMYWSSFDDATYGDFNRLINQTTGALSITLQHPASAGTIQISLPQIVLSKAAIDAKPDDVVLSSLTWEASRPLTGASLYTVQATVTNSAYLPY